MRLGTEPCRAAHILFNGPEAGIELREHFRRWHPSHAQVIELDGAERRERSQLGARHMDSIPQPGEGVPFPSLRNAGDDLGGGHCVLRTRYSSKR